MQKESDGDSDDNQQAQGEFLISWQHQPQKVFVSPHITSDRYPTFLALHTMVGYILSNNQMIYMKT